MTTTSWKHIGLHGHSVGTFSCEPDQIQWKSALLGGDEDIAAAANQAVPKSALKAALWTVFGKSGHLRLQLDSPGLPPELRFDGFPSTDFDTLNRTLRSQYACDLQKHNMSAAGTQYGLVNVQKNQLVYRHCILDDADEEGEEYEARAGNEMLSLDLGEVSQCVLPGNNRNEIELQFPESDAVEAGTDQLGK